MQAVRRPQVHGPRVWKMSARSKSISRRVLNGTPYAMPQGNVGQPSQDRFQPHRGHDPHSEWPAPRLRPYAYTRAYAPGGAGYGATLSRERGLVGFSRAVSAEIAIRAYAKAFDISSGATTIIESLRRWQELLVSVQVTSHRMARRDLCEHGFFLRTTRHGIGTAWMEMAA